MKTSILVLAGQLAFAAIFGAVTVQAHKFSKSAQEKITKAGGKFEALGAVEESKPETKAEPGKQAKSEAKQSKPKAE